jgi:hypothetical protein
VENRVEANCIRWISRYALNERWKLNIMKFRSLPLNRLSVGDLHNLLFQKDAFEQRWNKKGKIRLYPYQPTKRGGKKLVFDKTTELFWPQSGSPGAMTYAEASKYIRELNRQHFAKYTDWRLPTLDEAMSLLEPYKNDNGLYIDPEFDRAQPWIWTGEKTSADMAWVVTFQTGCCYVPIDTHYFVRAVRGEFWVPGDDTVDLSQI